MVLPPKIGVFDSGIGGLSVLREIHRLLPDHPTIYIADQANLPYGPRPITEIQTFSDRITRFLIEQGAAVIVIACHTASAASLEYLRAKYPTMPFVGMEPAIKPALETSKTGVVGVLSTRATAEGTLYKRLLNRYAEDKRVITQIAPELVRIAEEQSQHTTASRAIIANYVKPMVDAGADHIVLACTHFPFLADTIHELAGSNVRLVDPGPAVARQAARLWPVTAGHELVPNQYITSGDTVSFQHMLRTLIAVNTDVSKFA